MLAACGDDGGDAPGGRSGKGGGGAYSGPRSFKDDRGRPAHAGHRPERIVAFVGTAAALYDCGVRCTGILGPSKPVDGKPEPQTGDLDPAKVTSLGHEWGRSGIEKYAALRPDLLVGNMFPPPDLWFVPQEGKKKIEGLAPGVGISVARTSLSQPLRRTAEPAGSLGADLGAPRVADAKSRFDEAASTLRKAEAAGRGAA